MMDQDTIQAMKNGVNAAWNARQLTESQAAEAMAHLHALEAR